MDSVNPAEQNKLLLKIINASYDGIFVTDAIGTILYCNDSYLKISGLARRNLLHRNIADLVKCGEIPTACSLEVIETLKPVSKVIDYYHGVSALVTSIPIFGDDNRLTHVLSNVRDITELIKIKEQLKSTEGLKEEYRRRLKMAEEAINDNEMIAFSPDMIKIKRLAERVANVISPVLIQGESGVGKDMLARYIHDCSDIPGDRPFVQINCGAIPEQLLESELFGYEPGAFTGAAKKGKVGLMELANHGTLFLDEVGEMPLALQVKLLDVLHTGKTFRLGGTKTIEIKTRIIAATNTNLERLLEEGKFRRDLYYRLNVIPIHIPPLRERTEDLIPLIFHFVERKNRKYKLAKRLSPQVVDILTRYNWPGNIRELRNIIEHMVVMSEGDFIDERFIPLHIMRAAHKPLFIETPDYFESFDLKKIISEVEREVIKKALHKFGSLRKVAEHLKIDLSTLVRKKRKYKL
ncbi:MAG: sigma 54-interacting transcriptional regulator [Negativicutes bacterium]|nr:sigma 54-interacting transcriptional regulator [Negativicutes bacterium]